MRAIFKESTSTFTRGALALCLLSSSIASFAEPIGTVLIAVNKVTATNNGSQRTLSRGSSINLGDNVITGSGSKAQLKYTNGTLITLEANSNYQTLAYGAGKDQAIKGKIDSGELTYQSNGTKKGTIQTPVVALAILGTKFYLDVNKDRTKIHVYEGEVKGNDILLGPGETNVSGTFGVSGSFTPGPVSAPEVVPAGGSAGAGTSAIASGNPSAAANISSVNSNVNVTNGINTTTQVGTTTSEQADISFSSP